MDNDAARLLAERQRYAALLERHLWDIQAQDRALQDQSRDLAHTADLLWAAEQALRAAQDAAARTAAQTAAQTARDHARAAQDRAEERAALNDRLAQTQQDQAAQRARADRAEYDLTLIRSSSSWRLTRPLRALIALIVRGTRAGR